MRLELRCFACSSLVWLLGRAHVGDERVLEAIYVSKFWDVGLVSEDKLWGSVDISHKTREIEKESYKDDGGL